MSDLCRAMSHHCCNCGKRSYCSTLVKYEQLWYSDKQSAVPRAACCLDGDPITVYDNGDGTCSVIPPGTRTEVPCTEPLFGKRACTSIHCTVNIYFRLLNGTLLVQPKIQEQLDTLGIGGAQFVSKLNVESKYGWQYLWRGGSMITPSFYTSLRRVCPP
jgi:hypothetical protein